MHWFLNGTSRSDGRSSLVDDKDIGQKPRVDSDAITSIREEFDIDLCLTVSAIATMAYVSIWTVFMILTEYVHMSNVYALRMMKDSENERCVRDLKIVFKTLYEQECALSMKHHYRLHKNNSPPHTAASTLLELDMLGFGRVDHPPYSLDLAPFDFNVYPEVKSQLKRHQFSSLQELRSATANIISQYNQDWYRAYNLQQVGETTLKM